MRHAVLSLMIAFIAAIASFVLVPIIALVFLRIVLPRLFEDDTLSWILLLAGPIPFNLLSCITIVVGFVAFFVCKAKLPDRGWRSAQTFVVFLTFAATAAAAALITWPLFTTIEPPEAGPQQTGLPSLHLAQTLKAVGNRSGTVGFAWSTDGERLASYGYGETGISTWSPDGKYTNHFYRNSLGGNFLRYLSGHRLLITSPFAEADSDEERGKLADIAFSVVDAETGEVVQNIPGLHPGGRSPENAAIDLALSPDERFLAVISSRVKPRVNIYSTGDWREVATIDLNTGEKGDGLDPRGLGFSPDGKTLAVLHGLKGKIKFYEVESWTISGSIATYPDAFPPGHAVALSALSYSPDGTMIAVGADSGGSWWIPQNGLIKIPGSGTLKVEFPADPLRLYRVSDGKLIASLGSFPGGINGHGLVWSPHGEYLAFQDALGDIRFWSPFQQGLSVNVARKSTTYSNLLFSSDGTQLAANFSDGLRVFDVVPPAK